MENYALHTDLYEINMAYAYFNDGIHEKKAIFEIYFRKNPFNNGYAVFAGLERVIEYLDNFQFDNEQLEYLKTLGYDKSFLNYLSTLKFTGNLKSVLEGDLVFANEPLMIVEANLIEAQLIETALLNIVNFQTLIATKASRFRQLCKTQTLFEFGARRAQEIDAALWGTRAAYIGGFNGTSLVEAGKKFNIPLAGTHAHSFVQVYQDEYTAFKKYAMTHKECTFLVDTYDTIQSGIPTAIKVANELKETNNFNAIRIDSGDLAYQSKIARKMLDDAGYTNTKIIVSNDLDEDTISSLLLQDAKIDSFGIGTKLITAFDQPALGAVYKLVAIENDHNEYDDVIKISGNSEKITTPGNKSVYRVINSSTNKAEGDMICLYDEIIDESKPIVLFDEGNPLLKKVIENYYLINIHTNIFGNGNLLINIPDINQVKEYHNQQINLFWDEHKRLKNPAKYYVDLSEKCFENKQKLIEKHNVK